VEGAIHASVASMGDWAKILACCKCELSFAKNPVMKGCYGQVGQYGRETRARSVENSADGHATMKEISLVKIPQHSVKQQLQA